MLTIALALTAGVAMLVYRAAVVRDRLRFDRAVREARATIQTRLETYVAILRGGVALFAASEEVTRDEFHDYVHQLDLTAQYPGVQGIGFTMRIPPERDDSLASAVRREGLADFRVWPGGRRSERYAILYLEPLDRRNRTALGYDMFTEPTRRQAMERARDSGRPVASDRVTLVQEIDRHRQAGFLIYVPVYHGGDVPATVAGRRDSLAGFLYSAFRGDDLLRGIFDTLQTPLVDFRLYTDTLVAAAHLLHDSRRLRGDTARPRGQPAFRRLVAMGVAERIWGLEFTTRPAFEAGSQRRSVPLVLAGGLLVSAILFGLSRAQVRAQHRIAEIAADLLRSEQAIRQTQKLESIGLLAGGIAHDFNNLLTSILGNATLALGTLAPHDPARLPLEDVVHAAQRAATLTDQLLAYAGKSQLDLQSVDVCEVLRELTDLVRASLPPTVRLDLRLPNGCGHVEGDANQLEQLFLGLIMNGVEAIGNDVGRVVVSVERRIFDAAAVQDLNVLDVLPPGPYVEIRVNDTGSGMDEATIRQIFDPFFTTKFMGRGLGLAAAQGIARSHRGAIAVRSSPGSGSTFIVVLPLVA